MRRMVASYGTSSNQPDSPMPALFHIMSSPPPTLSAQKSARAPSRAALSVTSTTRVQNRSAPSSSVRAASPSALRSTAPTRQPLPWKSLAPSRPMPLAAPVMKTDFTTPGMKAFPSVRFDHVFDAIQRLRHITDVAPPTQKAAEHQVDAKPGRGAKPKRLGHVRALTRWRQLVVPVVHGPVAQ